MRILRRTSECDNATTNTQSMRLCWIHNVGVQCKQLWMWQKNSWNSCKILRLLQLVLYFRRALHIFFGTNQLRICYECYKPQKQPQISTTCNKLNWKTSKKKQKAKVVVKNSFITTPHRHMLLPEKFIALFEYLAVLP